ncbi:RNase H domain-containing protein [Trichonephila clavipes]|nr:RNase H domain-containing protein [Trichonephila clavipes]
MDQLEEVSSKVMRVFELPGAACVRDNVGVSKLTKLKRLSTSHQIPLQWIPSQRELEGNEIAVTLAKAGASKAPEPSAPLIFLEIFSRTKHQNKTAWITQSTIGISVLVLEALWIRVLQERIKLFLTAFEVAILKQLNFPKDARALKCA